MAYRMIGRGRMRLLRRRLPVLECLFEWHGFLLSFLVGAPVGMDASFFLLECIMMTGDYWFGWGSSEKVRSNVHVVLRYLGNEV